MRAAAPARHRSHPPCAAPRARRREARGEARPSAPSPVAPPSPGRGGRGGRGGASPAPSPSLGPAASPPAPPDADLAGAKGGDSRLAAAIEDLFGLEYRSVMAALSGPSKGATRERLSRTFMVDLAYPSKEGAGGASGGPDGPLPAGATPPPSPGKPGAPGARPAFADLLASSLRAVTETRAWFDDGAGYAWVRQQRVPLKLPKVRDAGGAWREWRGQPACAWARESALTAAHWGQPARN
jgi:hypothetical protein